MEARSSPDEGEAMSLLWESWNWTKLTFLFGDVHVKIGQMEIKIQKRPLHTYHRMQRFQMGKGRVAFNKDTPCEQMMHPYNWNIDAPIYYVMSTLHVILLLSPPKFYIQRMQECVSKVIFILIFCLKMFLKDLS